MKCISCKISFKPTAFNQKSCRLNDECMTFEAMYFLEKKRKADERKRNKEKAEKKKDLMTLSDWLKIAQTTFNAYIRKRDKGNFCISCQKPAKKENAGHFFNANNHYMVRFDEDNVNLQCEYCNTSLSGNLLRYRENLINKIGIERFEQLEAKAYLTRKFTIDEVKEINKTYKRKIKELKQ